jgi:ribose/xylose/arabinose/galactoside ABC-type transport system permease subunit
VADLQMWQLLVGFLSATFILPVIQQPRWSVQLRALVTFIYCVLAGWGTAYLTGAFDGIHNVRTAVSSILFTLVTAVASYKGFAQPTGIAPAIEHATSATPP